MEESEPFFIEYTILKATLFLCKSIRILYYMEPCCKINAKGIAVAEKEEEEMKWLSISIQFKSGCLFSCQPWKPFSLIQIDDLLEGIKMLIVFGRTEEMAWSELPETISQTSKQD